MNNAPIMLANTNDFNVVLGITDKLIETGSINKTEKELVSFALENRGVLLSKKDVNLESLTSSIKKAISNTYDTVIAFIKRVYNYIIELMKTASTKINELYNTIAKRISKLTDKRGYTKDEQVKVKKIIETNGDKDKDILEELVADAIGEKDVDIKNPEDYKPHTVESAFGTVGIVTNGSSNNVFVVKDDATILLTINNTIKAHKAVLKYVKSVANLFNDVSTINSKTPIARVEYLIKTRGNIIAAFYKDIKTITGVPCTYGFSIDTTGEITKLSKTKDISKDVDLSDIVEVPSDSNLLSYRNQLEKAKPTYNKIEKLINRISKTSVKLTKMLNKLKSSNMDNETSTKLVTLIQLLLEDQYLITTWFSKYSNNTATIINKLFDINDKGLIGIRK